MALRLTSANLHPQHDLVGGGAFLLADQVHDVLRFLDVTERQRRGAIDDVLARDDAGQHDVLAVARRRDRLTGKQLLDLRVERAQIARTATS